MISILRQRAKGPSRSFYSKRVLHVCEWFQMNLHFSLSKLFRYSPVFYFEYHSLVKSRTRDLLFKYRPIYP